MIRAIAVLTVLSTGLACQTPSPATDAPAPRTNRFDVLITGGRVVDGTGAPWFAGDVGIVGDRIAAIGQLADQSATTTHRCDESGGRAGLHRHARAVGVQRARRSAGGEQDHAGHHDRDYRRGHVDRAAQRSDRGAQEGTVRPLQGGAGLPHAGRVLRAAGARASGDQPRQLRRRRRRARQRHRRRVSAPPRRPSWSR